MGGEGNFTRRFSDESVFYELQKCDYRALCRQEREAFERKELPPVINTPVGELVIAAFEEEDGEL